MEFLPLSRRRSSARNVQSSEEQGWLNAMNSGKKWWIREFVLPYIFPLNPDYVAARSLRSLRSNNLNLNLIVENDERRTLIGYYNESSLS